MQPQNWLTDTVLGHPPQGWMRLLGAGAITLLSIVVVGVLWRRMGAIPDPGLILLFTVAIATYLAGGMAGMLSAAIVLFCSLVLFSHPLYPFRYSDMDWRQMMVIIVSCPRCHQKSYARYCGPRSRSHRPLISKVSGSSTKIPPGPLPSSSPNALM